MTGITKRVKTEAMSDVQGEVEVGTKEKGEILTLEKITPIFGEAKDDNSGALEIVHSGLEIFICHDSQGYKQNELD